MSPCKEYKLWAAVQSCSLYVCIANMLEESNTKAFSTSNFCIFVVRRFLYTSTLETSTIALACTSVLGALRQCSHQSWVQCPPHCSIHSSGDNLHTFFMHTFFIPIELTVRLLEDFFLGFSKECTHSFAISRRIPFLFRPDIFFPVLDLLGYLTHSFSPTHVAFAVVRAHICWSWFSARSLFISFSSVMTTCARIREDEWKLSEK
jgi:hypothetical protein